MVCMPHHEQVSSLISVSFHVRITRLPQYHFILEESGGTNYLKEALYFQLLIIHFCIVHFRCIVRISDKMSDVLSDEALPRTENARLED
uniref:Uncharacterized protein n=1 Tax=Candidatus Kentrum sp. MB TaxID=2138164 RepID=A0A450XJD1_9GAMM|nr:MAG: hypothetical protein BECKMB1821G_GA0114241_104826 [Candidatus Kentron sp. MB]